MVIDSNGAAPPQELETFLPKSQKNGTSTYKVAPTTKKIDLENGTLPDFDPFKERVVEHPTSDMDTLTHLLKASLGTGILAMPLGFSHVGLVTGLIATIVTAIICTHCAYVLVKCAHSLYGRTRKTQMTFAEVAEASCANGPEWARPWGRFMRNFTNYGLFCTYFGACAVYTVIIAENFKKVIDHYTGVDSNVRMYLLMLLLPLILLGYVPNLKYLAPFSTVANVFMGVGLLITFYYITQDLPPITDRPYHISLWALPQTFGIVIFAMEAIGVVMPLENSMKTPRHFLGLCGVLNQGMSGVALVYILLGFLGYVKYGDKAEGSITLNLPADEIPAQIVLVLIGLAVFFTFGLCLYVCIEIGWNFLKDKFTKRPTLVNYMMRTILVTSSVLLAVAVPKIGPFVGIIGAFFFSILGLLLPVFIEFATFWETGFGRFNWVVWKNILVITFGCMALYFGTKASIDEIIEMYMGPEKVTRNPS